MTSPAQRSRLHLPLRPLWLCRACGGPWPCGTARLTLAANYRNSRVALSIYLAGMLYTAVEDLYRLHPHDAPKARSAVRPFPRLDPPAPGPGTGLSMTQFPVSHGTELHSVMRAQQQVLALR